MDYIYIKEKKYELERIYKRYLNILISNDAFNKY